MRDECKMCNATMITDEGADPTDICHDCAHARVDFLERRIAEVEDECKTSTLQAKKAFARQLELEEALVLIGECTACPLCKNRALDALAGGASKRKKNDGTSGHHTKLPQSEKLIFGRNL